MNIKNLRRKTKKENIVDNSEIINSDEIIEKKGINYVCSLGQNCFTARLLKNNNLKKASYPYDWTITTINMIIDTIKTNFKYYNDNKYLSVVYSEDNEKMLYNSHYKRPIFNHHNLFEEKDKKYMERCILRFNLLLSKKNVLYINAFVVDNTDNISYEDYRNKNDILYQTLKEKNQDFYYLSIIIFNSKEEKHMSYIRNDVRYIEYYSQNYFSKANFIKNAEYHNKNIMNMINKYYNINLFDDVKLDNDETVKGKFYK